VHGTRLCHMRPSRTPHGVEEMRVNDIACEVLRAEVRCSTARRKTQNRRTSI
jgi:hypothetical protein